MITRRNLLYLLSSAGLTAGAPGIVNTVSAQDKSARLAAPGEDYLRLEDFGGVADGVTDNSQALNAALNALKNTNGGTIVFPNGITKLTGSATVNFLGKEGAVRLIGSGGSSVVHVAKGTDIAIGVYNTTKLNVENITFIGTLTPGWNDNFVDCTRGVINCGHVEQVTISNCKFLGIAIAAPYGEPWNGYAPNKTHGIVSVDTGGLLVERCYFGGCATLNCANVNVNQWNDLTIRNSRFIDWGYYNGQTISKTGHITNTSWVRTLNPISDLNVPVRGRIKIEGTNFDEGCVYGIFIYGARWLDIEGITMNGGLYPAIEILNVVHTRIKDSLIGYINTNVGIHASGSKVIELESVVFGANVKFVVLDPGVSKLISRYSTLPGNASYPNGIINNANATLDIIN